MRKPLLTLTLATTTLFAAGGLARAAVDPEPIPPDYIQQLIPFALEIIQKQFPNPAVKVEPNGDKTVGYHVQEQVGVVAIPDKNLTAKTVETAAEKEVPVAILATRNLSLQEKDKETAIPTEKVAVADLNGMFKIPTFFLSVKGKGEERTLQVYSKDGTALASVPLKKQAAAADPLVDLKLTNIDLEKKKLDVTVSISGTHEATLKLAVQEF